MAGHYDGTALEIEVVHRYFTMPFELNGTLRIDLNAFYREIIFGIQKAIDAFGSIVSIGVDSWGGQPTVINAEGKLLETPYHYRDSYKKGLSEEIHRRVSDEELYRITGTHESKLPDLFAHVVGRSPDFSRTDRILLIPDYFDYLLCGGKTVEYTNTMVTQFLYIHTDSWAETVLKKIGVPLRLFGEIVRPGTYLGDLKALTSSSRAIAMVAVGSHDTAAFSLLIELISEIYILAPRVLHSCIARSPMAPPPNIATVSPESMSTLLIAFTATQVGSMTAPCSKLSSSGKWCSFPSVSSSATTTYSTNLPSMSF